MRFTRDMSQDELITVLPSMWRNYLPTRVHEKRSTDVRLVRQDSKLASKLSDLQRLRVNLSTGAVSLW